MHVFVYVLLVCGSVRCKSYIVSVYRHNNRANHSRIQATQESDGTTKYYLVRNLVFDSLYQLIEFYKHNVLRTQNFDLCLREPVPKIPSPEGKP